MESNRFSSESLYRSTFLVLRCRNAKPCEVIRFLAPLPQIQTGGLCIYRYVVSDRFGYNRNLRLPNRKIRILVFHCVLTKLFIVFDNIIVQYFEKSLTMKKKILPSLSSSRPDDLYTILNEITKLQPNPSAQSETLPTSAQPAYFRFGSKASWTEGFGCNFVYSFCMV